MPVARGDFARVGLEAVHIGEDGEAERPVAEYEGVVGVEEMACFGGYLLAYSV